ncbi:hypothetical protein BDF20DRAFT_36728 [Mycotypha africana]|uniref:uncharacterized protein n=1 Tax=Mycotypha africana TaxID=64632 RepID=UPI0023002189|nr:uncharacterized protein BDF20DRAFT_36728 [Mycotypha africana]KAI8991343.1 hypothetical protein BDF20DRAFT_36728 [Mycotypha africana]
MTCCLKHSLLHLLLIDLIFFVCACCLLVLSLLAIENRIPNCILFPINIFKMLTILGLLLLFNSLIGIVYTYFFNKNNKKTEARRLRILYISVICITFIYQLSIGILIYDEASTHNISNWLLNFHNNILTAAPTTASHIRYIEAKFQCRYYLATTGSTAVNMITSSSTCYEPIIHYVQTVLSKFYISLFATLPIELIFLSLVFFIS